MLPGIYFVYPWLLFYVATYSDIPLAELNSYSKSYHDIFSLWLNLCPCKLGIATTKQY